jgi:methanogenic corrinoid protein MtbC1
VFLWCAYCQRYIGESSPFDDHSLSHGLCPSCDAANAFGKPLSPGVGRIRELHARLRACVLAGDLEAASALVDASAALGIRPLDLALGMMQPVLQEIGELWAQGRLDVAHEHVATGLVQRLLELAYSRFPESARLRNADAPAVLLCTAPSNRHTIGLDLVELALTAGGIPTQRMTLAASARDIAVRVEAVGPKWVGVSIALPSQMADAEDVAASVEALGLGRPPRVVAGGGCCRGHVAARPEGLSVVADAAQFQAMVAH